MHKTILITGSTDGIGLQAARKFASDGHRVLLHGRNQHKLNRSLDNIASGQGCTEISGYCCDLSDFNAVAKLADTLQSELAAIDVIINNAGVLKTDQPETADGLDARFAVNAIAPFLLTRRLLPLCPTQGRIINLSSAAQSTVNPDALQRYQPMTDMEAYAQSKLAITMWSAHLASQLGDEGPLVITVNPGSLLATNMVKEGFGIEGKDINIGADILVHLALSTQPDIATGLYYDNDAGQFSHPHDDATDTSMNEMISDTIEGMLKQRGLL